MTKPDYMKYDGRLPEPPYVTEDHMEEHRGTDTPRQRLSDERIKQLVDNAMLGATQCADVSPAECIEHAIRLAIKEAASSEKTVTEDSPARAKVLSWWPSAAAVHHPDGTWGVKDHLMRGGWLTQGHSSEEEAWDVVAKGIK